MDSKLKIAGVVLGAAVVGVTLWLLLAPREISYGGTSHMNSALVLGSTLSVAGATTLTGAVTSPAGITIGSSGTAIDKHVSTATTIDVDSVGAGAATTSAVTLTGAAIGDTVVVGLTGDWGSASSTMKVSGSITAANVATLYFVNASSSALNLSGSSYRVDAWSH